MHTINYVSISFRQANKFIEPLARDEGNWAWQPNVLMDMPHNSTCSSSCVSRAHTLHYLMSLLVPPLYLCLSTCETFLSCRTVMWNFLICGTLYYYDSPSEHYIIMIFIIPDSTTTSDHGRIPLAEHRQDCTLFTTSIQPRTIVVYWCAISWC